MTEAVLGLRVESSQAKSAAADLEKLAAVSAKAENAAEKLGRATKTIDLSKIEAGVASSNAALEKLIGVAERTQEAILKLNRIPPPKAPPIPKPDPKPFEETSKAVQLTSHQLLNLSRQGNDVITMWMMGADGMQIFASQAGQVYDALESGPQGLRGSLKAIGEGLMGLVTRFPLATAAIGAAGAAMVAYQLFGGKEIKSLDDILKQHEGYIKALGPAYRGVLRDVENYSGQSANVINRLLAINKDDAKKQLNSQITEVLNEIFFGKLQGIGANSYGAITQQMLAPITELMGQLGKGKITVREFQSEIEKIGAGNPVFNTLANDIIKATQEIASAETAIYGMRDEVTATEQKFAALNAAIAAVSSTPVRTEMEAMRDKIVAGTASVDEIKSAIATLSGMRPDLSGAIEEFQRLAMAALAASSTIDGLAGKTGRIKPDALSDQDFNNRFGSAVPQGKEWKDFFPDLFPKAKKGRGGRSGRSPEERAAEAYQQLIKSADDRIKQVQHEIDLQGKFGASVEASRFEMDLINRATDRGRTISKEQRDEIERLADKYGKLKQALAEAKLYQDLLFDREQMFRSPTDQLIADTMRGAGLEVDFNSPIAGVIRFNEQLRQTKDLVQDVVGGIVSDLTSALDDGKITWEEFGQIGLNALSKIADKLIQMATDELITSLMGNLFGGGGGGLLGGLFGGGGGGSAFPAAPVGLWARGGAFNSGNVVPFAKGGAFTNSVVTRRTPFSFAKGTALGEVGEAGPEAIMPLKRGPNGSLGVSLFGQVANQNGGQGGTTTMRLIMPEGWRAEIVGEARQGAQQDSVKLIQENEKAHRNMRQNGGTY